MALMFGQVEVEFPWSGGKRITLEGHYSIEISSYNLTSMKISILE